MKEWVGHLSGDSKRSDSLKNLICDVLIRHYVAHLLDNEKAKAKKMNGFNTGDIPPLAHRSKDAVKLPDRLPPAPSPEHL
jgi:hypothetical protein